MGLYSFGKLQRLSKRNWIQELFGKGSSFYSYPFKIIYFELPDQGLPHQMLVTVSAKSIKQATLRNRIKRRVREAYRLNQHHLTRESKLAIGFIYTPKEPLEFKEIQNKMVKTLKRLSTEKGPVPTSGL